MTEEVEERAGSFAVSRRPMPLAEATSTCGYCGTRFTVYAYETADLDPLANSSANLRARHLENCPKVEEGVRAQLGMPTRTTG